MQTSQAYTKAQAARTLAECDHALDDIRATIKAFEPESGAHLHYLGKLYEERDAYIHRRRELTREPTPEIKLEVLRNALRMVNFRACEALRAGGDSTHLLEIMRIARDAIYSNYGK